VYHESVTIDTSGVTVTGRPGAVIDATGFTNGILVTGGAINPGPPPSCPPPGLHDITVRGLTIRNADRTGVRLVGVDGFEVSGGRYLNNALYAVFPICSTNGLVSDNDASGISDAALYVGSSDSVNLTGNRVTRSTVGVEVENSTNISVTRNLTTGNSAGIITFVLPGRPAPITDGVLIADNTVTNNNLDRPDIGAPVDAVPTGTGVLSLAADHVTITGNTVTNNDTGGIGVLDFPPTAADPRSEPNPDGNRVIGNVVLHNGTDPDPDRSPVPGADLIYNGTGTGNCFADNVFRTQFPAGITSAFACN